MPKPQTTDKLYHDSTPKVTLFLSTVSTGFGSCEGIVSSFVGRWCFGAMTALPAETPLPLLQLPSRVKSGKDNVGSFSLQQTRHKHSRFICSALQFVPMQTPKMRETSFIYVFIGVSYLNYAELYTLKFQMVPSPFFDGNRMKTDIGTTMVWKVHFWGGLFSSLCSPLHCCHRWWVLSLA